MEPLLKLVNVDLSYHTREAETTAIKGLDMEVGEGEFVAIVGPSGCGKSTVLSMIAGLLQPSSGDVLLRGRRITKPDPAIGYMLQRDHLFEWRTIWQNVLLGLDVRRDKSAKARERAARLLETYGLAEFRNSRPSELSGGMRQRVALIRTLAIDPEILLLDEPFSALDYQTRLALADEIYSIIKNEGKTALFVTHDIAEAVSIAGRVVVFSGRPASVRDDIAIDLGAGAPLSRRSHPDFRRYFEDIRKELDINV